MATPKEELNRLIVRELAFHVMVERGLADADAKRTISNEDMGWRIRSWHVTRGDGVGFPR